MFAWKLAVGHLVWYCTRLFVRAPVVLLAAPITKTRLRQVTAVHALQISCSAASLTLVVRVVGTTRCRSVVRKEFITGRATVVARFALALTVGCSLDRPVPAITAAAATAWWSLAFRTNRPAHQPYFPVLPQVSFRRLHPRVIPAHIRVSDQARPRAWSLIRFRVSLPASYRPPLLAPFPALGRA